MLNQFVQTLTGVGVVTTPAVALWLVILGLNLALKDGEQIKKWELTKPRLAAFVGVLEAAGFDPRKTAEKTKAFLLALLKSRYG